MQLLLFLNQKKKVKSEEGKKFHDHSSNFEQANFAAVADHVEEKTLTDVKIFDIIREVFR